MIGLILGVAYWSVLVAISFFVIFSAVGILWEGDEPPVLPFAIAYQSIYVLSGYVYQDTGGVATNSPAGELERAIGLALVGFAVLAVGMRTGLNFGPKRMTGKVARDFDRRFIIRRVFWYTIAVYSVNWMFEIVPMQIFFNAAQLIYAALTIRQVLLALLWLNILRQRSGYHYGVLATVFALIPSFIAKQSDFKDFLLLLVVVLMTEWRPWSALPAIQRQNRRILLAVYGLIFGMLCMGVLWEGAIKPNTRTAQIEGSPMEKLERVVSLIRQPIRELNFQDGFVALLNRLDGISQFSLVLERVPNTIPYENGALLQHSLQHVCMPRILFPEKMNLGGSSWMATKYAGITVGEGTSVGIGYMAEFYVDFGPVGMFPPLFAFGVLLGWIWRLLRSFGEPTLAKAIVIVPFLNHFLGFEGEFAKILGGLITNVLMLLMFGYFVALMSNAKKDAGQIFPSIMKPKRKRVNLKVATMTGHGSVGPQPLVGRDT